MAGYRASIRIRRVVPSGVTRHEQRSPAGDMIEVADLKERVRKLESIAACIDL